MSDKETQGTTIHEDVEAKIKSVMEKEGHMNVDTILSLYRNGYEGTQMSADTITNLDDCYKNRMERVPRLEVIKKRDVHWKDVIILNVNPHLGRPQIHTYGDSKAFPGIMEIVRNRGIAHANKIGIYLGEVQGPEVEYPYTSKCSRASHAGEPLCYHPIHYTDQYTHLKNEGIHYRFGSGTMPSERINFSGFDKKEPEAVEPTSTPTGRTFHVDLAHPRWDNNLAAATAVVRILREMKPLGFLGKPLDNVLDAISETGANAIMTLVLEHPLFQEIPGLQNPEVQKVLREKFVSLLVTPIKSLTPQMLEAVQDMIKEKPELYRKAVRSVWKETNPEYIPALDREFPTPVGLLESCDLSTKGEVPTLQQASVNEDNITAWFQSIMGTSSK